MSSEFERRLSVEELKQLNRPQTMPPQSAPMPPAYPPQWEWDELLVALNRLEASVGAQEALVRALTRQVGQLPTQVQLEALARDVAQIQATLKQAGKAVERSPGVDPVRDATTMHQHGDRKALRKEKAKKIALGHKEDDYEEEQNWQQTMH